MSNDEMVNAAKEVETLTELNCEIDQLASTARDCSNLAPELSHALDIAWYISEVSMRELGNGSCGHVSYAQTKGYYCPCCSHFAKMRGIGERVRKLLYASY